MTHAITLHGRPYLLVGDLATGGAIATPEQYENGDTPFAHLFSDGRVLRFGVQIATRDDIALLPEAIDVEYEEKTP